MTTFITRTDVGAGTTIAIKDLIDIAGYPTTAGCRAVADQARAAATDAACLSEISREVSAGRLRLVGKANLHELGYGTTGTNHWFGTPRNPLNPRLIPGGSSSGSAVAVADGDADIALGTDTGGSVRIPAACCGVAGLKTTWGRISLDGVWPLAPSLDTVGPLARTVAGLVHGMQLLEPGFTVTAPDPVQVRVSRLRLDGNPAVHAAIDDAIQRAELRVTEVADLGWRQAWADGDVVLSAEAWHSDRDLLRDHRSGVSGPIATRLAAGAGITAASVGRARQARQVWRARLLGVLESHSVIALPTLADFPPALDVVGFPGNRDTLPVNFAGFPALSLPVPSSGPLPASLQLIAAPGGEELLLGLGAVIEAACGR